MRRLRAKCGTSRPPCQKAGAGRGLGLSPTIPLAPASVQHKGMVVQGISRFATVALRCCKGIGLAVTRVLVAVLGCLLAGGCLGVEGGT